MGSNPRVGPRQGAAPPGEPPDTGGPPSPGDSTASKTTRDAALAERVTHQLAEYAAAASDRREAIARDLAKEGEPVLPHLVHALDSPSPAIQTAATQLLGRYRNRKLRDLLLEYARERGVIDRDPAAPMDVLAGPLPIETALALLDDDDVPREAATDALAALYGRFRLDPREVDALRRIGYVHAAALPPEAQAVVDALRSRLESPELKRRLVAIEAARALRMKPLLPELIACLGTEGAREAAHAALREITRQDLPLDRSAWEKWHQEAAKEGTSY